MGARGLGKTGQKVAKEWLIEQLYNRKPEFSNKFTQKGLIVEYDAIDLVADFFNYGLLIKNEKHFSNDFLTGTPDLILKDKTIDIKSSWDISTFPLFNEELDKAYYWQGIGYMALTGKRQHEVIYCLMDTPKHLIEREAYSYCRNNGIEELEQDLYDEFERKMTFSDIPEKLRVKKYSFEFSQSDYDKVIERVEECREFIKTLTT